MAVRLLLHFFEFQMLYFQCKYDNIASIPNCFKSLFLMTKKNKKDALFSFDTLTWVGFDLWRAK
uniref:Sodium-bile acid cotransporter n=1 Tax=Rhizophora mucronata TaxID=61149 RepID=A0A2P2LB64_RHIMU